MTSDDPDNTSEISDAELDTQAADEVLEDEDLLTSEPPSFEGLDDDGPPPVGGERRSGFRATDPDPSDPAAGGSGKRQTAFMGVPIEVLISVGRARPLVSDIVKLRRDSVLELDSRIDDPVEIYIGDRMIARGELQEMDDGTGRLGVRLTEVADLSNGI